MMEGFLCMYFKAFLQLIVQILAFCKNMLNLEPL